MQTALQKIFQEYKGILAADERPTSMDKRLVQYGIKPGSSVRDRYRRMLFSTPNLERTISGVILSEDTFLEHTMESEYTRDYLKKDLGIIVGVKVDDGLEPYDESGNLFVTKGLERLDAICNKYAKQGAEFVKWRSIIPVNGASETFLKTMAETMAEYAQTALRYNLIPVIEPEVLLKGKHALDESAETLKKTISAVLSALKDRKCNPHQCILKTSFAATGLENTPAPADAVAKKTLEVFQSIGLDDQKGFYGIVFLSGGLPSATAIEYIQRIRAIAEEPGTPHTFRPPITFSYGRALQESALTQWQGSDNNTYKAQIAFTQTLQHAIKKYKGVEMAPMAGDGKG